MVAHSVRHAAQILGVDPTAPFADVRRSYRRLLFACHPDRNPTTDSDLGAARVRQICLAFDIVVADRAGTETSLLGRRLERMTAEIDAILTTAARRGVAGHPDVRFVSASEHRGHRLDIAA